MPNRFLIILLLLFSIQNINFGQQDPQFSQYFFNQLSYNPAIASTESLPKVQILQRSQYLGYTSNFDAGGTLNTQMLSFQMPLLKSNSGVGIVIINDQAGLEKNQQLKLLYAKNLKVSGGNLSIGASIGFYNKSFNNSFRPRENNDPSIPANGFNQLRPDFGIGINYAAKVYFVGVSINHLNNPKFDFGATNGNSVINRTINGIVGVNIPISSKIELKPNILFRSDLQTYNIEGGILANIGNKYWTGINYRRQDAAILMAGLNLMKNNALKLGLSYDFVTEQKYIKSASSFEIIASYVIGGKSNKVQRVPAKNPIIRTPRYRH